MKVRLLSKLRRRAPQIFRRGLQLGVIAFIVYAALGTPWRNYKVAHNNARLVGLMHGETVGSLYRANDRLLEAIGGDGNALEASLMFLGMPGSARLFGVDLADPVMALSHVVRVRSVTASLALGLIAPVLLVLLLGKVFCSHLCPMRLCFELAQAVRRGLERIGLPLPEARGGPRLGGWVLLGGLVASLIVGHSVWLFLLPYTALGAGLLLAITGGAATALLLVIAVLAFVDMAAAPGYFCHNLCPTGFLLEQLGRAAPVKLRKRGEDPCPAGCRVCEVACPYALSPRTMTHAPACDSCGRCAALCPSERLERGLARPLLGGDARRKRRAARASAAPAAKVSAALLVALAIGFGAPATARAHHNKGLPHYGYFKNYPQVPTQEYVRIRGRWEFGATVFNFQGLDRRSADTPNDVKIYCYLYDLKADKAYLGAVRFEIRKDGKRVRAFARDKVDEEAIYSTRETLPESGTYELVAHVRGATVKLPFTIDIAGEGPSLWVIGGIGLPVLLVFVLALLGRRQKLRKARRDKDDRGRGDRDASGASKGAAAAGALALALLLAPSSGRAAPTSQPTSRPAATSQPTSRPAATSQPTSQPTSRPAATSAMPAGHCGSGGSNAMLGAPAPSSGKHAAPASKHATHSGKHAMHGKHGGHAKMQHYKTPDGGTVMVMGGFPLWLLLLGVGGVIVLSFVATEWLAPRAKQGFRKNLVKNKRVYRWLRSRWFQAIPQLLMIAVLALLIYVGLVGSRVKNLTPVMVWTIWWGGLIFAVLLFGALWCFVCPWDGLANLASRLRLSKRVESLSLKLPFPSWLKNVYPAILLFCVLTWLELGFGVTSDPRWTAYLGLGMSAAAVVCALLWGEKVFCKHLCPVGRICGIYGNFSPIEIRAKKAKTCEVCSTEDCLHGNEHGYPCPTGISLKTVGEATMCTMCTECVKSCNKHNVAINLRPFGGDLREIKAPRVDVAWLAVFLLALTLFHGLSMTPAWESFKPGAMSLLKWMMVTLGLSRIASFTVGMLVAIAVPAALYWLSCRAGAWWAGGTVAPRELFVRYAYSLLPIALFYHLAHNLMHVLMEAGHAVPLLSDPLGRGSDYFGTAHSTIGPLVGEKTLWFMQIGLILVGHVYGVIVAHRAARDLYPNPHAARRSLMPMLLFVVALSVAALYLMHMDMNMRVGRM